MCITKCVIIDKFELSEWETWKVHHAKNYSDNMEEKFRLKIFMENKAKIARHNSLAHSGEKSYYLKVIFKSK